MVFMNNFPLKIIVMYNATLLLWNIFRNKPIGLQGFFFQVKKNSILRYVPIYTVCRTTYTFV